VFKRFHGTDTFIAKTVTALQVGLSTFRLMLFRGNITAWSAGLTGYTVCARENIAALYLRLFTYTVCSYRGLLAVAIRVLIAAVAGIAFLPFVCLSVS